MVNKQKTRVAVKSSVPARPSTAARELERCLAKQVKQSVRRLANILRELEGSRAG